jgi:RHS repeat-associated protein
MLDNLSLIHMNGRVMDPLLGRFVSADPNIDGVMDTQGWNRYSYVKNGPLSATDPSGFNAERRRARRDAGSGGELDDLELALARGFFFSSNAAGLAEGMEGVRSSGSVIDAQQATFAGLRARADARRSGAESSATNNGANPDARSSGTQSGARQGEAGGGTAAPTVSDHDPTLEMVQVTANRSRPRPSQSQLAAPVQSWQIRSGTLGQGRSSVGNFRFGPIGEPGARSALAARAFMEDPNTSPETREIALIGAAVVLGVLSAGTVYEIVAVGGVTVRVEAARVSLNPKIYAQLEKQLADPRSGAKSIHTALRSAEQTLAEHKVALETYRAAGGYTSYVEKTIRNVESQIATLKQFIRDNGL